MATVFAGRGLMNLIEGKSVEIAGGFLMMTVPSDVRVQPANGISPQTKNAKAVLGSRVMVSTASNISAMSTQTWIFLRRHIA